MGVLKRRRPGQSVSTKIVPRTSTRVVISDGLVGLISQRSYSGLVEEKEEKSSMEQLMAQEMIYSSEEQSRRKW